MCSYVCPRDFFLYDKIEVCNKRFIKGFFITIINNCSLIKIICDNKRIVTMNRQEARKLKLILTRNYLAIKEIAFRYSINIPTV